MTASGFQTIVNTQPAQGVAGDFASNNPRATYDAGPGGLVAGPNGVTIGAFAWTTSPLDLNNTNQIANSSGIGPVAGFVAREQQGLLLNYLQIAGMTIPTGFGVTLFTQGDFWVVNNGSGQALVGQKCYANYATGLASFAATGSPTTGGSGTASTISAQTASVTASIAGNVMTVSAVGSGTLVPGGVLSGTGVATGTTIVSQISGTTGGVGTYYVSIPEQTVASTTVSETYGLLTIGGTVTGSFSVGDVLSGTSVTAGSTLTGFGTGTGGAGTYYTQTQTTSSTTISATSNVETKWIAMSSGAAGEIVKISSWALG
jgi:hypothetical protein